MIGLAVDQKLNSLKLLLGRILKIEVLVRSNCTIDGPIMRLVFGSQSVAPIEIVTAIDILFRFKLINMGEIAKEFTDGEGGVDKPQIRFRRILET